MCHPIPLPPTVFVLLPQKLEKKSRQNAASISLSFFLGSGLATETKMKLVELQDEKRG
jgi:hypothetical protein